METSGKLKVAASGDREIIMTRTFEARRELVFRAWTEPALLKRWLLGPDGWSMPVCEVDLRVGGAYYYLWRNDAGGQQFGLRGVFREILPPERIVHTERFEGAFESGEALVTLVLTEENGRTTATTTVISPSKEERDGMLQSGMEKGVATSYNRLEGVLSSMV